MIRIKVDPKSFAAIEGVPKAIAKVIVASNIDLYNALLDGTAKGTVGTPVDTNAARASWYVQLNGNPPPAKPQDGGSKGQKQAVPQPSMPVALFDSAGKRLTIANGIGYLAQLEYLGHSKQAPNGWIRHNAALYSVFISDNVAKVQAGG